MLYSIKRLFTRTEDYAGRDIDKVIASLAVNSGTPAHVWSYLKEQAVYENTVNGLRVYPHEVGKYAA
ncbi:hypothetical protein [Psychromonas sp. MME2]|uniref:hypothetical protein n=1 Tax=unclassified Psychromonas TaxID=2614957 RepID=UPI00339C5282